MGSDTTMIQSILRPPFLFLVRRGLLPSFLSYRLYPHIRPQYVVVADSKLYLGDCNWLTLWANGVYEAWTTDVVKSELKQGDVFVDVGANIGYFTIMGSKLVGERGQVYAFEPNPFSFEILRRNVETNNLHNVTIEQKAVTNFSGRVELWANKGNTYAWKEGSRIPFSADCVRLDDYFQGQHIDLMKMDIDGGETTALEGTFEMSSNDIEKLIIEFWPIGFRKQGINPETFASMLANRGFSSYTSSFRDSFRQTELNKFLATYAALEHSYYDSLNLFCVKD